MSGILKSTNTKYSVILTILLVFSIGVFCFHNRAFSDVVDTIGITVNASCTFSIADNRNYTVSITPGNEVVLPAEPISITCNDDSGFAVYAIGFTNDSYNIDNTVLQSNLGPAFNIQTNTSGPESYWAMKISSSGIDTPTIDNEFGEYHIIPATFTKIAHYDGLSTNSIISPIYKISIKQNQAAGNYEGKVKYVVVHPNDASAPTPPPKKTIETATTMQEVESCPVSLEVGTRNTLIDIRDGKEYGVAKLTDDKCWMTTNLDLEGGTALYGDESNVPKYLTKNNGTPYYTLPNSTEIGFHDNSMPFIYNSHNYDCSSNMPCYSYYSFVAATAGGSITYGDSEYDICPKNWRLPNEIEIRELEQQYQISQSDTNAIFKPELSGYYYNSTFGGSGSFGNYWSSTAKSSVASYYLSLSANNMRVSDNGKRFGLSVRCVTKD